MTRNELRKLRGELKPYIAAITAIGGRTTQSIFNHVFEEDGQGIEFDDDEDWMTRLLANLIIEDLIQNQEHARTPKDVTVNEQKIVATMAAALLQCIRMRSLVADGYSPSMASDYVISQFVLLAVNDLDIDLDRSIIVWQLLEDLTLKLGSALRRLNPVFTMVKKEVVESKDPRYATFVLIANLENRRVDKMLLKKIMAEEEEGWWKA